MKRKRKSKKQSNQPTLSFYFSKQKEKKKEIKQKKESKPRKKRKRFSSAVRNKIAAQQKWKCNHCLELLTDTFEVDHIIPLHKDGTNELSNLQALCRNCHGRKTIDEAILRADPNFVFVKKIVVSKYFKNKCICHRATEKECILFQQKKFFF